MINTKKSSIFRNPQENNECKNIKPTDSLIMTNILYFHSRFDCENLHSSTNRIAIVHFILERQRFSNEEHGRQNYGIEKLLKEGVYNDAYPLHDVSSNDLLLSPSFHSYFRVNSSKPVVRGISFFWNGAVPRNG